ncbi:TonB-dependent receptor plug domain-containing protein [Vitreoscilla stercoraria]|uniref:TonB-dependent receptor plug domain-containing protein n=1 Tax=Vitreoscilla stercoraria TaxID=61 RepID=A0ABY4E6I7_VITST|nr:TonB-dependent receptor plug domain-containing protein [Vitreoscilla stercoraria]UOO91391.1 TonB-dependent receptor plug domain-containing protein [Vitreoscilla stercoraria]
MSSTSSKKFHLALLSTAILLAYAPVYATDVPDAATETNTELNAIVVVGSAGKVGGIKFHDTRSADIIKRNSMDEQAVHKVDEAIANQAGVLTNMYGNDNKVDWFKIRGFDASVAIDGNVTTPNGFFVWLPETYGLESIEVIKGANSNLYGAANAGGVVNLVSKRPKTEPAGEVKLGLGTDKRGSIGADYSGVLTEDNSVRYRVVAQARREDSQIEFANMKHYYFAPSLTWDISEHTNLTLLASYQHEKADPPMVSCPLMAPSSIPHTAKLTVTPPWENPVLIRLTAPKSLLVMSCSMTLAMVGNSAKITAIAI